MRRLSLVFPANDDDKEFLLFGEQSPYLRDVRLQGIRLRWTPGLFGNLVHLDYIHQVVTPSHDAVQEVLAMLTTSSRLQTLTIGFQSTTRHSPSSWSTRNTIQFVPLSSLKKLTLRFLRGDFRRELLVLVKRLKLPILKELQLANDAPHCLSRKLLAEIVRPFRYHPSLRLVSLNHACFHPRQLYGFIQALPMLRSIVIARASIHLLETFEQLLGQDFRVKGQQRRLIFYRHRIPGSSMLK